MTYSLDFRNKFLSVRASENLTISSVSTRFGVGIATVVRWLKRVEPHRTRIKPATKVNRILLAEDVRHYPDAYQLERAQRLGVSESGIGHALRRMNISIKKNTQTSTGRRGKAARVSGKDQDLSIR
jgi:transposase